MSGQSDPYVRVYYRILDDPRFTSVYDSDVALATWLRLLLAADAMFPASAPFPQGISRHGVKVLHTAGIIEMLPGKKYRLHGLEAERDRRGERARKAANARWGNDADADADAMQTHSKRNANAMLAKPSLAKPSRNEPSQAEPATLQASELPAEDDSATIACRQLFDSGKWLGDREYVAAWDDMDRRYSSEWVQAEIPTAFAACLESRGKVLPWDLRRMTEQRLAERTRADEKSREAASRRAVEVVQQRSAVAPEEKERQSLIRRAVEIWAHGGRRGKVPEKVQELRDWIAANEQGAS